MTWHSESAIGTNFLTSSSQRFGLDKDDKSSILVYRYRSSSSGLKISSQHDLYKCLDTGKFAKYLRYHLQFLNERPPIDLNFPNLQVVKKKIT